MQQDRSEYYKNLYENRQVNNRLGNPLVNPSNDFVSLAQTETIPTYNTKNISKNFEYISQSQIEQEKARRALEEYKASRNWWQRTWDTVVDFGENVTEGFVNFVDKAKDALVGFVGLFSTNEDYHKDIQNIIADDTWVKETSNALNKIASAPFSAMNLELFKEDYYKKNNADKVAVSSYLSDLHPDVQNIVKGVEQGIGEYLPQVALAVITSGASVPAQVAIQGGVSAVSGYGAGLETAFQNGADYWKGQLYGATEGAISGAVTAVTVGIGGSFLTSSNGVASSLGHKFGDAVYKLTSNQTLRTIGKDVVEIATKAGISATRAFATALLDPVVKSIYDNGDALANAYGDNEKIMNTLKNAGISSAIASITSTIISGARKGIDIIKADGYKNYVANTGSYEDYVANFNISKASREIKKVEKAMKSLTKDYDKLSQKELMNRVEEISKLNDKINEYSKRAVDAYKGVEATLDKDGKVEIPNTLKTLAGLRLNHRRKIFTFLTEYKYGDWKDNEGFVWNETETSSNGETTTEPSAYYKTEDGKELPLLVYGREPVLQISADKGKIGDITENLPTNKIAIPTKNGNNLLIDVSKLNSEERQALNNIKNELKQEGDFYVLKVNDEETIKWDVSQYNPMAIYEINGQIVEQPQVEINPLKDPEGYITTSDNRKIGLTNGYKEALNELQNETLGYEDYLVGETDYKDGYISKRYVNKLNNWADKVLNRVRDFYDDSMEIEDIEDFNALIEFAEQYANEDFYGSLQELIDEVDYCEYPDDNPPDYEYIAELIDYLYNLENNIDSLKEDFEARNTNVKDYGATFDKTNDELSYIDSGENNNDNGRIETTSNVPNKGQETKGSNLKGNGKQPTRLQKILGDEISLRGNPSRLGIIKGHTGQKYITKLSGNDFHKLFAEIHKNLPLAEQCIVDLHDVADYQEGKTFVRTDGLAVGFVNKDGNIISVANEDKSKKGFAKDFLDYAVKNGGNHLDCMNSTNEDSVNLPYAYSKNGFIPVAKVKYDREIMLLDHSEEMVNAFEERFGKADLVFMVYSGTNKPIFTREKGGLQFALDYINNLDYSDYDTALKIQQEIVERGGIKLPTTRQFEDGIKTPKGTVKDNNPANIPFEYIKDSANLNNLKVWNWREAEKAVKQITRELYNAVSVEEKDAKITYDGKGILKTTDELARLIDKKNVSPNEIAQGLNDIFTNINIVSKKNGISKLDLQKDPAIMETLKERIKALIEKGGKISKTQLLKKAYVSARLAVKEEIHKRKENNRSFKLLESIQKKIESGSKTYFSAPNEAPLELGTFKILVDNVKAPFTPTTMNNLVGNILTNYNESNFGEMYGRYGLPLNSVITDLTSLLQNSIGTRITSENLALSNNILDLISKDMTELKNAVIGSNRRFVRDEVVKTMAITNGLKVSSPAIERIKNATTRFLNTAKGQVNILETELGTDNPFVKFVRDDSMDCINNMIQAKNELLKLVVKNDKELSKVKKLLSEKIDFAGKKITLDTACKIDNLRRTLNNDEVFVKTGGSLTVGGTRVDVNFTLEELDKLREEISNRPDVAKFNDKLGNGFNYEVRKYTENKFKEITGAELPKNNVDFYYPIARIGDKGGIGGGIFGSINPSDWGLSFLKERHLNTRNRFSFDGGILEDYNNHITKLTRWGEFADYYRKFKIYLDTRAFGFGTTLNYQLERLIPNFKSVRSIMEKSILGLPIKDGDMNLLTAIDSGLGSILSNLRAMALVAPFTQIKTLGSWFTALQYRGFSESFKGIGLYIKYGGTGKADKFAFDQMKKYSPSLYKRFKGSEVIVANLGKELRTNLGKYSMTLMTKLDMLIHTGTMGFYSSLAKVFDKYGKDIDLDKAYKLAVKDLEQMSNKTQPTSNLFNVSALRIGALGDIAKYTFGLFASMGQNIFQGLSDITLGWYKGVARLKSYDKQIGEENQKAQEYRDKEQLARAKANEATDEETKAKLNEEADEYKAHAEGHEQSADTLKNAYDSEKGKYTFKQWLHKSSAYIAGLIGSGLALTLIASLKKRVYGQKEWDEWNPKNFAIESSYASFVNWMPYIGTLTNAIRNNTDVSILTMDSINDVIDIVRGVVVAIQKGEGLGGALLKSLTTLSTLFGIPAKAVWDLVNGVWYNIDHESNLRAKNLLGMLSSTSLRNNFNDGAKNGLDNKAKANLSVWLYQYSAGTTEEITEELYRLKSVGQGALPKALMTSYENDKGETISLTSAESQNFGQTYTKATKEVQALIKSSEYKSLDDEYKARAIRKIYDAYYDYAKAVALKQTTSSKLVNLLNTTQNGLSIGKYMGLFTKLSKIVATKLKTRKELMLEEINKNTSLSKVEKLLMAWLNGLSLTNQNKASLGNYLIKLGGSKTAVKELLA